MQKQAKAILVAPVTATPDGRWAFECPHSCGEKSSVAEKDLGKKIPCAKCTKEFRIGDKPADAPEPTPVATGTAPANPPPAKPKADPPKPKSTVDLSKATRTFPTPKRPTPPTDDTHHTSNNWRDEWKKWAALVAVALALVAGGWIAGRLSAPDNSPRVLEAIQKLEIPKVKTAEISGIENKLDAVSAKIGNTTTSVVNEIQSIKSSASAEATAGLEKQVTGLKTELKEANEAYDAILDLLEVPADGDMSLQKLEVSGIGKVFRVVNSSGEGKVATP